VNKEIQRKRECVSATTGVGSGGYFTYGHNVELELYPHTYGQNDVPSGQETMISILASGMDRPVQVKIEDLKKALKRLYPRKQKLKKNS
jgi:hypothetical protein